VASNNTRIFHPEKVGFSLPSGEGFAIK